MSKSHALKKIKELVIKYKENETEYLAKDYKENHAETHFVIPFFEALGWDFKISASHLREVYTQDSLLVKGSKRAPDYGFCIPGSDRRLFYVEAKTPAEKLKTEQEPAFQLRRYGRSGETAVSILFNFRELAVYDCTQKQTKASDAKFARMKYFTCDEYVDNFDYIYDTFSREAVYNGNFNRYIQDKTKKKGNVSLDKDFVESLNVWRLNLAKSIAKNNYKLNDEEINIAVQLLLDRIIFLRFCEERDVEPYGQLEAIVKHKHSYKHLFDLFNVADQKYNSGIFDFKKDELTEKLNIEDSVIKEIIEDLYPPKSDYAFSIMPVEILGNAYEQFLGNVIRITAGHNIKIEEKKEVRKAGGVFYTPQYIVDYIVENTVGKLINGKSPKEIEKIKIVDPACGSGSFLLGAYKYLINYHIKWYYTQNKKSNKLNDNGTLTTDEKRNILTNNIFGVDLDTNAVEVSKLSLLLKCMEGETASSVKQQIKMHHTRVLPNIDKNIVNGNSLIGFDFTDGELELDKKAKEEFEHSIKPFDWKVTFPSVFKQGGFDAVIGNPPYVFTRDVDWPDEVKSYYWNKFGISKTNDASRKNQSGKINLYVLFILKSTELINKNGQISYIIPNGLLRTTTYDTTRKFLLDKTSITNIVDLKEGVFEGVTASTIIIQYTAKTKEENKIKIIDAFYKKDGFINENIVSFKKQSSFLKNVSYTFSLYINEEESKLFNNLTKSKFFFKDITLDIIEGIVAHKEFLEEKKISEKYKPYLEGKDIKPFQINFNSRYILFDRKKLHRARPDYVWSAEKKIVIQRISGGTSPLVAGIDSNKYLAFASTNLLLIKDEFIEKYSYELICALLNSKLINFYYSKSFSNSSNLTVNISKTFLEMIPIPIEPDKTISKNISALSKVIADLKEDLKKEKNNSKIGTIQQHITYNENKLNQLVYKLYDLTDEEKTIIEG